MDDIVGGVIRDCDLRFTLGALHCRSDADKEAVEEEEEEVEGEELVEGVRPRGSSGAAPPGRLGLTPVSRLRQSRSLSCCRPSGLWPSSSTTTARSSPASG